MIEQVTQLYNSTHMKIRHQSQASNKIPQRVSHMDATPQKPKGSLYPITNSPARNLKTSGNGLNLNLFPAAPLELKQKRSPQRQLKQNTSIDNLSEKINL